jgi:hypothetical protein
MINAGSPHKRLVQYKSSNSDPQSGSRTKSERVNAIDHGVSFDVSQGEKQGSQKQGADPKPEDNG